MERDGEDQAHVEDMLEIETLMGWDGDRCRCTVCVCQRFLDGSDNEWCPECLAGDHSGTHG